MIIASNVKQNATSNKSSIVFSLILFAPFLSALLLIGCPENRFGLRPHLRPCRFVVPNNLLKHLTIARCFDLPLSNLLFQTNSISGASSGIKRLVTDKALCLPAPQIEIFNNLSNKRLFPHN